MAALMVSVSRTSPGNHKLLLAATLCIAAAASSFLPGSSASTPLVDQTCGRTSNPRLCVSLLSSTSGNGSRSATTVRQLAITALRGAKRSAVDGRLRAFELSHGPAGARRRTSTPAGRVRLALAAECAALYIECLRAAGLALGRVIHMSPARDDRVRVAGAVAALRSFPEQCQRLYDARKIVSPLAHTNWETQEKLGIASEIVRLLR